MHTLGNLLARWSALLGALFKPLGAWGVFAIAGIDAALFGLPLDPLVAGYVFKHPERFWVYILMAAAGSALAGAVSAAVGPA